MARDVLEYLGVPADLVQGGCRGGAGEIQARYRRDMGDIGEMEDLRSLGEDAEAERDVGRFRGDI